jgi:ubiquinone/menaquinone biosynthesis C-methylase UbiE
VGLVVERASNAAIIPPWVRLEHLARYQFAATFASGKVVVDCACGDGTGTDLFAKSRAKMVHAFDKSPETIAHATRLFGREGVRFAVADAANLSLASNSADVYISLETIEHLLDDAAYLREAMRVLRPEGLFICSTPNRIVTNPGATLTTKPWNPFHVCEYSESEFVSLLSRHFGELQLFGQNRQSTAYTLLARWMGRRLPGLFAVRMNQVLKLSRFVLDNLSRHAVVPHRPGAIFEYLVAVCKKV